MRQLSPDELDQLFRSNRNLKISMWTLLGVLVPALIGLSFVGINLAVTGATGAFIGGLLLIPQQSLLRRLGLSGPEARAILEAERERRSGAAQQPPEVRAARDRRFGHVYLVIGLACAVLLIVCMSYFFPKAGQTTVEGEPGDPWFGISFFVGFASLIAAPSFISAARQRYAQAKTYR
ncbi:hypothetical protein [Catenuloplanes japonicus]|uniref:hypothetical protein n=1 Tax=Catenuloplanes japonicus TaxID=33876 RepID=UPI0005248B92|nr:hypothetical protein [Catenuloplanes japonicus]